jgi:DNA polymerase elongation subunit (family B)
MISGIEARRHDTPKFIKEFQIDLLNTLFDCNNTEEVVTKGYENALLLVIRAIDKIMTGGDDIAQDLVISKLLGQNIEKYKCLFPHVCAAIQLSSTNDEKSLSKGVNIKYIFTVAQHSNPLCRVTPVKEAEKWIFGYDKEK